MATRSTALKTAKSRPRTTRVQTVDPDDEPILRLETHVPDGLEDTVALFSLDDVVYRIPRVAHANVALKYMHMVRHQSQDVAMAYILEAVLGPSAYVALMEHDGLRPEELAQILAAVQTVVMGSAELPKESASRA